MKYYVEMLDWRGSSFKKAREILGMSRSDILDMVNGPFEMEDLIDSEFVDACIPVKEYLVYIYNELLIGDWRSGRNPDANCRFHSTYVNYSKMPSKPKV